MPGGKSEIGAQRNRPPEFLGGLGIIFGAASWISGQPKRRLRIGHTGITWGFKPEDATGAIHDIGSLGYEGYETFGEYLDGGN